MDEAWPDEKSWQDVGPAKGAALASAPKGKTAPTKGKGFAAPAKGKGPRDGKGPGEDSPTETRPGGRGRPNRARRGR